VLVLTLVLAGVTFSMVHWSNTSHVRYAKTRPGNPTILPAPVPADFRTAKREGVLRIAAEFVNTAVRRQHVSVSYDLATPTLRSGLAAGSRLSRPEAQERPGRSLRPEP
jgi:hypothetical protein